LQVETNRHIALGEILNKLAVKKELLDYVCKTEALVYTVPERENSPEYQATFVRNLQNFLVLNPGKDYDKDIRKSYLQGRLGGIPRILISGAFNDTLCVNEGETPTP